MNPVNLLKKYYQGNRKAYSIVLSHSIAVERKALEIVKKSENLNINKKFLVNAAILHDVGVFLTEAPKISCFGRHSYVCHGLLGRELLEKEGFQEYGLVCERHVGVGLTKKDIKERNLPLPCREMTPETVEEEIICLADKFFSKKSGNLREHGMSEIRKELSVYGKEKVFLFDNMARKYNLTDA